MEISYNWLKEYINIDLGVEEISEILTGIGLEIEGIHTFESIKGGLKHVCIGKVITCEKHPNADRLHVTQVDIGQENLLQIVCGATNVAAGQHVVVACVGAALYPMDKEPLTIKKSKIRDVVSEGMICAEDELGISNSHAGIMVLSDCPQIGMPAQQYFNITTDTIFEIGLTPNRSDATSHLGVARDLVAYINTHYHEKISLNYPEVNDFPINTPKNIIQITIADTVACPRYTGLHIAGVEIEESPEWLKTKLNAIGIRPINNIVDITQFVLFEMGQPLHAFDANNIKGNHVIIRKVAKETPFLSLDGIERKLSENDLMICNEVEPMCIAGVMGGEDSGINEATTDVFLESAYFNPISIRKTSKYHGIKTDASFRFERGCDPNICIYALKRAALLIQKIAGGTISGITDIYPSIIKEKEVSLSYKRLNTLIGKEIEKKTVKEILTSLEMKILNETNENISIAIPTNKNDVTREADVIEEFLRIYGYNNIELKQNFSFTPSAIAESPLIALKENVSNYLSNNGFCEIMNNSLTKSEYTHFDFINKQESISLLNPLSKDLQNMRQTLLFGGLESIINNINRSNFNLRLFEFGSVYRKDCSKTKKNTVIERFPYHNHLALFVSGKQHEDSWQNKANDLDFFYVKNIVLNVLQKNNFNVNKFSLAIGKNEGAFQQVLTYTINNQTIITIGEVHPTVLKVFGIKQKVYSAEVDCDALINLSERKKIMFKELNKYPEVHRDLALLLDKHVTYEEVEKLAYKTAKPYLKAVNLFDVYEGKNLEEGKKSYAVSFVLSDTNKTLTNDEINAVMDRLITAYEKELQAKLR
ncbi:MAG: phenylalanine--tRNA ligase subunit beta [Bacteroidales bacterium]|jgi:phenylalanyl-tRNA synthetase beta chain|nr:phenylalanine--tRNA ligase subunit beta [Bacteroidales bacterium]